MNIGIPRSVAIATLGLGIAALGQTTYAGTEIGIVGGASSSALALNNAGTDSALNWRP